eukprot:11883859-Ditylum_brightwellii.AAC.1
MSYGPVGPNYKQNTCRLQTSIQCNSGVDNGTGEGKLYSPEQIIWAVANKFQGACCMMMDLAKYLSPTLDSKAHDVLRVYSSG